MKKISSMRYGYYYGFIFGLLGVMFGGIGAIMLIGYLNLYIIVAGTGIPASVIALYLYFYVEVEGAPEE